LFFGRVNRYARNGCNATKTADATTASIIGFVALIIYVLAFAAYIACVALHETPLKMKDD